MRSSYVAALAQRNRMIAPSLLACPISPWILIPLSTLFASPVAAVRLCIDKLAQCLYPRVWVALRGRQSESRRMASHLQLPYERTMLHHKIVENLSLSQVAGAQPPVKQACSAVRTQAFVESGASTLERAMRYLLDDIMQMIRLLLQVSLCHRDHIVTAVWV